MKYTPKELKDNVNVSHALFIREFFILSGSIFGVIFVIYITLGLIVNIIAPIVPIRIEKAIGNFYSKKWIDKERNK